MAGERKRLLLELVAFFVVVALIVTFTMRAGRGDGSSDDSRVPSSSDSRILMGTVVTVTIYGAEDEAAREAIERARNDGGPSLIHVRLNRYYGHFEGDAISYKAQGEIEKVKAEKDALMLFRNRVTEAGLLDGEPMDEIDKACRDRIEQVLAEAKAAPMPTEADLLTDVYTSAY